MKTATQNLKKYLAVLLAVMMALSVFSVGAGAVDAAAKPRFIFDEDNYLRGLDFSDLIRDMSTVNKGELRVDDEETSNWASGYFDADSGIVRFGDYDKRGTFRAVAIGLCSINYNFTLYAEDGGKLFDDVAAFTFTMQDVCDSLPDDVPIYLVHPDLAVSKTDGEIVQEMTLNFNPARAKSGSLLDKVDMTKEITLTADITGGGLLDFRAVPVRYEDGVLTVALYDGEKADVPLHGVAEIRNGTPLAILNYSFLVKIPEGMLGYGNKTIAASDVYYDQSAVDGLPIRTLAEANYPEWLWSAVMGIVEKMPLDSHVERALKTCIVTHMLILANPLWYVQFFRNWVKSLRDYGFDLSDALLRSLKEQLIDWFDRT